MKYSSLFTHPSHLPINRAFGEVKSRLNSSPLFTYVSATIIKEASGKSNYQVSWFCLSSTSI